MRKTIMLLALAGCGDGNKAAPADGAPPPPPPPVDAPVGPSIDDFTDEERALLERLTPLPAVPPDPTNAFADDAKAAALGQMLFFDKDFSGPLVVGDDGTNGGVGKVGDVGKVSCASCHAVGSVALDDRRSRPNNVSLGTNFMGRNALGLVNSSYYRWTNWGGRFDSQWSLPTAVAENGTTMRSTRLDVAHMLFQKYRAEYDAIFPVPLDPALDPAAADASRFPPSGKPAAPNDPPGAFESMTDADKLIVNRIFANYGKALAAYTRKLTSGNAPFDRYVAGDRAAIADSAKRGLHLFLAKCTGCHINPHFSDDDFHALGVPQTGVRVPATDNGRFQDVPGLLGSAFNSNGAFSDDATTGRLDNLVQVDAQRGQFRTKSLRNIGGSGPFMHAGQFATLADVVDFYNAGGGEVAAGVVKDPKIVPLGLDTQQRDDLVAFLSTLTGEPIAAELLVDTSK